MELWAKLSMPQKYMAGGAVAVIVGWILGLVLGNAQECVEFLGTKTCVSTINYFNWGTAGLLGLLALLAAIAVLVVLFLMISPQANITWPMPVSQILLGLAGIAAICAILMTLIQVTNGGNPPVLMYVADAVMIIGAAAATWFAYNEWTAGKAA